MLGERLAVNHSILAQDDSSFLRRILCVVARIALGELALGRQMESLSRGLVAIETEDQKVFLSWRLLGSEPLTTPFNLFRSMGGRD